MSWFRQWQAFVQRKSPDPPGPIDNTPILINKGGAHNVKPGIITTKVLQIFSHLSY